MLGHRPQLAEVEEDDATCTLSGKRSTIASSIQNAILFSAAVIETESARQRHEWSLLSDCENGQVQRCIG